MTIDQAPFTDKNKECVVSLRNGGETLVLALVLLKILGGQSRWSSVLGAGIRIWIL